MNGIEHNLARYLAMEALLNEFFGVFDYCLTRCIRPAMEKIGNRPVAACCKKTYYCLYDLDHPAFDRLKEEREMRYGKPGDNTWMSPVSPCEYHNPLSGCVLATHKSPICLAFMCRESIDYLRETYGLYTYDYLGVNYALEWILTGDLPEDQYHEFKADIETMIRTITGKTL